MSEKYTKKIIKTVPFTEYGKLCDEMVQLNASQKNGLLYSIEILESGSVALTTLASLE